MQKTFLAQNIQTLKIIAPERLLIKKIKQSLNLIEKVNRNEYKNLFKRIHIIFITNRYGHTNEFFMPEKIWFANKSVIKNNDVGWLASLIIHEAFHATQFKNGKYIAPLLRLEAPAMMVQKQFLQKIKDPNASTDIKKVVRQKYWRRMDKDKTSCAYFRNLLNLLKKDKINLK